MLTSELKRKSDLKRDLEELFFFEHMGTRRLETNLWKNNSSELVVDMQQGCPYW